jgi:HEAT repeat protein
VPTLNDLLVELTSGDEERAEAAVPALIELGQEAVTALLEMLSSPDPDRRWWAIRVLAQTPQARGEWLLPFLEDPEEEVRQAAALGLCSLPDTDAIPALLRALADPDSMVSTLACNALIAVGKPAVPGLLEYLKGATQTARINAMRALAEIEDHRAIPALMAAFEEDSVMLHHWAEEGLERLGLNMVYLKPE